MPQRAAPPNALPLAASAADDSVGASASGVCAGVVGREVVESGLQHGARVEFEMGRHENVARACGKHVGDVEAAGTPEAGGDVSVAEQHEQELALRLVASDRHADEVRFGPVAEEFFAPAHRYTFRVAAGGLQPAIATGTSVTSGPSMR